MNFTDMHSRQREREREETYSFDGFERERGVAIENAYGPRALIVLLATEPCDPRAAHVRRDHEPRVQSADRPQNDKRKQEIRKS